MRVFPALLVLTWSLPLAALSPDARPLAENAGRVGVLVGAARDPDATETRVVLMETGTAPREVATIQHAVGMVPRGTWDPSTGVLWLLVDDPRLGPEATLVSLRLGAPPRRVLEGLDPRQTPALTKDGSVVVFSRAPAPGAPVDVWDVHRVWPDGNTARVGSRSAAWVVPAGADEKDRACVLSQDGPLAQIACGSGTLATRHLFRGELVRDVTVRGSQAVALERRDGAWGVTTVSLGSGTARLLGSAVRTASVTWGGDTVLWSSGPGGGLVVDRGGKQWTWGVGEGATMVPLSLDATGSVAVVRWDSLEGTAPARHGVLDLISGRTADILAGGPVLEVYGVRRTGVAP